MKATIVKNNNFETIGFEVVASSKTLFSWGISPSSPFYFTKQVSTEEWIVQIVDLIKLQATIIERNDFVSNFFKVSCKAFPKQKQSANFQEYEEKTAKLIQQLENIIKNII